jgi:hypothetical protein
VFDLPQCSGSGQAAKRERKNKDARKCSCPFQFAVSRPQREQAQAFAKSGISGKQKRKSSIKTEKVSSRP